MPPKADTLGSRIGFLRDRRQWTQKELAEKAGLSATFISEIENDKRNISASVLLALAKELRASVDYLLTGQDTGSMPRQDDVVPPQLAEAADEEGWSYGETLDTLKVRRTVVARRTPAGAVDKNIREWTKENWLELHRRIFE